MLNPVTAQVDDTILEKLTNDKKEMNAKSLSEVVRKKIEDAYKRESSEEEIKALKKEMEEIKKVVSKILGASIHNTVSLAQFIRAMTKEETFREIKNFADQKLEEYKATGKLEL